MATNRSTSGQCCTGAWGYALKSLEAPSRIFMEGSVVLDRMPLKRCTHCLRTTSSHHNLIMRIFREHECCVSNTPSYTHPPTHPPNHA